MEEVESCASAQAHVVEGVRTTEITYSTTEPKVVRFESSFNPKIKPGDWVRFRDYRSRGYREGRVVWVTHTHNYHDDYHVTEAALEL